MTWFSRIHPSGISMNVQMGLSIDSLFMTKGRISMIAKWQLEIWRGLFGTSILLQPMRVHSGVISSPMYPSVTTLNEVLTSTRQRP